MATLAETATALSVKIKTLEDKVSLKLNELDRACERLSKAGLKVADSWSGSTLGYHAELHYGDFEKPPLHADFSPEWGGIHGLPDGWYPRTSDEVRQRIEELAGAKFECVDKDTAIVLQNAKALHAEIVTELSGLHAVDALQRERELLDKMERLNGARPLATTCRRTGQHRPSLGTGRRLLKALTCLRTCTSWGVAYQNETRCARSRDLPRRP
jgi:hypothetical protein